ncbi:MAG: hypothetical protein HKN13_10295, partial [Rhodothermales bacterium]|nr:hypothetical protein [Rhodothermales bacterium]
SAVRGIVDVACERAVERRSVIQDGAFYWNGSVKQAVHVRNRNALPDDSRAVSLVHENEIATAFDRVVLGTGGIYQEDAIREVRKLLGYARSSEEIDARLQMVLNRSVEEGLLTRRNGVLML